MDIGSTFDASELFRVFTASLICLLTNNEYSAYIALVIELASSRIILDPVEYILILSNVPSSSRIGTSPSGPTVSFIGW